MMIMLGPKVKMHYFSRLKLFGYAKHMILFASVIQTPDKSLQPAEQLKCRASASIKLHMENMGE